MTGKAPKSPEAYTIAWIAALPIERGVAEAMLDEEHDTPVGFVKHETDENTYKWGRIGEHNVIIVSLAAGVYGTMSAATTASNLLASLPSIRVGLLVGIGGGIARPDNGHDIRLGDIAVSQPDGTTGGVCQYDSIKAKSGDVRERKGFLRPPPTVLLKALAGIQAYHEREDSRVPGLIREMLSRYPKMGRSTKTNPGYGHQGLKNDRLFAASYSHVPVADCHDFRESRDCHHCDTACEVTRDDRETTDPEIHYGIIASGNTLVKDATTRDRILEDIGEDCICFEMEAAGLMNHFPCLVIRGICDYVDSHKNNRWQRYASAVAAAYAKEFLAYVPKTEVQETKRALEVLQSVEQRIEDVHRATLATKAMNESFRHDDQAGKIYRWLSPSDPSTNSNHARKLRLEGSGAWFLESAAFRGWQSDSLQHLWLYGLSGCGKTVLIATILDHLQASKHVVLNFFFDFTDAAKRSADGMLRSLASQLCQRSAQSETQLRIMFESFHNGRNQPTTDALLEVVCKMLHNHQKVYLVLDAIDESTTTSELLRCLRHIINTTILVDLRLLCTGRPEIELQRDVPDLIGERSCVQVDIKAINADIDLYVTARLDRSPEFTRWATFPTVLEQIRTAIVRKSSGMFRWAACQLDSLEKCLDREEIEIALASLPQDLNETYARMLDRIPSGRKQKAIRLLQFLAFSERPLTLQEAVDVVAIRIDRFHGVFNAGDRMPVPSEIVGLCPSLVSLIQIHGSSDSDTRQELHLSHFSVKEYLRVSGVPEFSGVQPSISITCTCLSYLSCVGKVKENIATRFPFAKYAARVWIDHALLAEESNDVLHLVSAFLLRDITFVTWTRIHQPDYPWDNEPGATEASCLYFACLKGLIKVAKHLISQGIGVNAHGGLFGNALQAASQNGKLEVVSVLLANNADVNAKGGVYGNALHAASYEGHLEIVRLLLANAADVKAWGGEYGNALQAASSGGHTEIVKLLIAKKADVNARIGPYGNALQAASRKGDAEMAELLLANEASVNAPGGKYGNALYAASLRGHIKVVRLLLGKKADVSGLFGMYGDLSEDGPKGGYGEKVNVNIQGGECGNALQAASSGGYIRIVELLLVNKANVNAQGGKYGNTLQAASSGGYIKIVELLLANKADVNAQGGEYGNALQAASSGGYIRIVELLLANKANVNAQGGKYGNALQAASSGGHVRIVRLLLAMNANISGLVRRYNGLALAYPRFTDIEMTNVNAQLGELGNARQATFSSRHGHLFEDHSRVSYDEKVDVNAEGGEYGTALQAASSGGYTEVAELLLTKGANVHARGGKYGNALQAASLGGYIETVKLLLANEADVNARGGEYSNALYAASSGGYAEVAELLLTKGANVHARGGKYGNALQAASLGGHIETVKLLLANEADVNAWGGEYSNALYAASSGGYTEIVQLLLANKANVNAQGEYGNALQAASLGGYIEIVELLLANKADVNARFMPYRFALYAASHEGYFEMLKLPRAGKANVNSWIEFCGNALYAASSGGYAEIVQLLLANKANVNAQGGKYGNALQAASSEGYTETVKLLLADKADVNARDPEGSNALYAASSGGYAEIVQLLLANKADVNARGGKYGNALYAASSGGYTEVVELLLANKANVNAHGDKYGSALQVASSGGYTRIVKLLLANKAEVNAKGGLYGNAVYAASLGGHTEIVRMLLAELAEFHIDAGEEGNALEAAASGGHAEIVKLLLVNAADMNARDGKYDNALLVASRKGYTATTRFLLLQCRANVHAEDGEYGNALYAASLGGHTEIVKLLIAYKANVNARIEPYGNALYAASSGGYTEIVELLLANKADVNAQGGKYGNALQAASSEGHIRTVRLLVANKADVNAQGGKYGNALQAASSGGYTRIVKLLLANKADVNAQGGEYGNALQAASSGGYTKIVELLLANGAYVHAQGGKYGNALYAASLGGHVKIATLLWVNDAGASSLVASTAGFLALQQQEAERLAMSTRQKRSNSL